MFGRIIMVVAAAGALFLPAANVSAADETVQIKEVVVTATRTEKEQKDVTQSVTVITAEDIKKSGATTAAEVIERTSGVEINDYGTRGSLSNISIRGASYQQVLVLLDGRRMNSASAGGFDMSDLPVLMSEIERIEIVRGPSSALYGADAVGGVVNIITKKTTAAETMRDSGGRDAMDISLLLSRTQTNWINSSMHYQRASRSLKATATTTNWTKNWSAPSSATSFLRIPRWS